MYVDSVIVKYFLINLCNKINLIDVWRCEVLCKFVILIKKKYVLILCVWLCLIYCVKM